MRPPLEGEMTLAEAAQIMARALRMVAQGHAYDPKCQCARCEPIRKAVEVAKKVRAEG